MSRFVLAIVLIVINCLAYAQKTIICEEKVSQGESFSIKEGILCQHAQRIKYKKNGKTLAIIKLDEPVIISMADDLQEWGYYQFPALGIAKDGTLIVSWAMQEDSHKNYGKDTKTIFMMSKDKGQTWSLPDKNYIAPRARYRLVTKQGYGMVVMTPSPKDISDYPDFPQPICKQGDKTFYHIEQLPEELQGVYINAGYVGEKDTTYHATLSDPGLLRYDIDGLMPIVWWGNIKELSDGSIIAGVYPAYYEDGNGHVLPGGVSFYRSTDKGHSWNIQGKILFPDELVKNSKRYGRATEGAFTEPAFEILDDGTLLCVMRTGGSSPMYKSMSNDNGITWSQPNPFTPNGVMPQLLKLDNGIIVLASGRPGLQIRFSIAGSGNDWTEPIEMMSFKNDDDSIDWLASCGYPFILKSGKNSFYLVYSDFREKNVKGEERKAIKFRKITIRKK